MAYHLLTAAVAFLLGLSVGSIAIGQKHESTSAEKTRHSTEQHPVSALAIAPSSAANTDSPVSDQDAKSPGPDSGGKGGGPVSIELDPVSESGQIRILTSRWNNLESLVSRLATRVRGLEQELTTLKSEREADTNTAFEALPLATPEDRRIALEAAGVPQITAEEIVWRQSELELERLELQDRAMREDWYRTNRYYKALRELNRDSIDLRSEIGEQAYDQYLYQTGETNRVNVKSVIQGSVAEQFGLLPGDIIESYGSERIYNYSDLRRATAEGDRDEMVPVLIRRDDIFIEVIMSRGPMGVRIKADTAAPSS